MRTQIATLATGAALATGCLAASEPANPRGSARPTTPPPPRESAETTEVGVNVAGPRWATPHEAQALVGCEISRDELDRYKCGWLTSTRNFQPTALTFCRRFFTSAPAAGLECLAVAADQTLGQEEAKVCAELKQSSDAMRCLDAVVGRDLASSEVQRCEAKGGPARTVRCLRNAYEYVFDFPSLRALADKAAAAAANSPSDPASTAKVQAMLDTTRAALEDVLPASAKREENPFLLNFAGGAIGHYKMLYCSMHEYLMVFGTALASGGYSGQYRFEVHDLLLTGKMQTHTSGELTTEVFGPGGWAQLTPGESKIYTTVDGTYMLEYARGPIASGYQFGIVHPSRTISRDRKNRRDQIRTCSRAVRRNEAANRKRAKERRESRARLQREILAQLAAMDHPADTG